MYPLDPKYETLKDLKWKILWKRGIKFPTMEEEFEALDLAWYEWFDSLTPEHRAYIRDRIEKEGADCDREALLEFFSLQPSKEAKNSEEDSIVY